jgi:hypothetical protein
MATLNKTLIENYDITGGDIEFEINRTQHYKVFVVEAVMSGMTYPGGDPDAKLEFHDGEINDAHGTQTVDYELCCDAEVTITGSMTRAKIRVANLATRNAKVVFKVGALSAGTIDSLTITFQT